MSNSDETPSIDESECVVRGEVTRVVFHNPQNGYSVLRLRPQGTVTEITVVGSFINPIIGNYFLLRGQHGTHPKYGQQFSAYRALPTTPSTREEIERYLASGTIKGIGKKTAERLVEAFGADALKMIESDPQMAAKKSGVQPAKIGIITSALADQSVERETVRFLIEHEISPNLAQRIYQFYGSQTLEVVQNDPFRLARDIDGIGFLTADSIAARLGLAKDAPSRIQAAIRYTLERAAENDGHCHLSVKATLTQVESLLEYSDPERLIQQILILVDQGQLVQRDELLLLPYIDAAESYVSQFIARRVRPLDQASLDAKAIDSAINDVQTELKLEFSLEQKQCVIESYLSPLLIVTGGPGCGKTTIIRAISRLFSNAGKVVRLAAPTGRAAQRMAQVCELDASTIHRLLKFDPRTREFTFGAKEPLIADIVIIDEISMIDIYLARSLFAAISDHTTLVLVGDKDQLPSVGPGRVLGDLLSLSAIKAIGLSRIFRRNDESSISAHAHIINAGQIPEIPTPDGETKTDAYFIPRSVEDCAATVEKLVADQLPNKFGFSADDILVLSPSNRGPLGIKVLNQKLQEALNPNIDPEQQLEVGDNCLRLGDRVCQRVNNYKIDDNGVFNGDIGRIHQIDKSKNELIVEMWDGRLIKYTRAHANELSLGYALTVHRSQGSEIPCVVLVLHDSHYTLLHRQLLYTAVTRAKKLLIIVGSRRAFSLACRRTSTQRRLTLLAERIQDKLKLL